MRHRLFAILSVLSLVLCVASIAAWTAQWNFNFGLFDRRTCCIGVYDGRIVFESGILHYGYSVYIARIRFLTRSGSSDGNATVLRRHMVNLCSDNQGRFSRRPQSSLFRSGFLPPRPA